MISKKLTFTLLLFLSATLGYAQNIKDRVSLEESHKPNASKGETGKDVVSVDLYTGTGSVNIPIYDCNVDGLDVGVSLNYVAKGIRVDEVASSIGLGWNLNIGGGIVREVNGTEDEVTMPISFAHPDYVTYVGVDSLQGSLVLGAHITDSLSGTAFGDDLEKDIFHFTFGGRSLSVVFVRDGGTIKYMSYPHSEVKIELQTKDIHFSGESPTSYYNVRDGMQKTHGLRKYHDVLTFILTDEKGNKFYFERGNYQFKEFDMISKTGYGSPSFTPETGTYYSTNEWDLVKILTFTGQEILYEYKYKNFSYVENRSEILYPRAIEGLVGDGLTYDPFEIKDNYWTGNKSHIRRITYPNGTYAQFDVDTNRCDCKSDYTLLGVHIVNKTNDSNYNSFYYELDHDYFNSPMPISGVTASCSTINGLSIATEKKKEYKDRGLRLKLKGIKRFATGSYQNSLGDLVSNEEKLYEFGYNSTPLPYRFWPSKDYYGYYNGETPIPHIRQTYSNDWDTIYTSIPFGTNGDIVYLQSLGSGLGTWNGSSKFGVYRTFDETYAQACILTTIKNGKGGEISLTYDGVSYLTNPSCSYGNLTTTTRGFGANTAIGCNIDADLDGTTTPDGLVVERIDYSDRYNALTSGLAHKTSTVYTYRDGERFNRGGYTTYSFGVNGKWVLTNFFVSPNNYYNGSNHGYSTVNVTEYGFNEVVLSRKEYKFSNLMYKSGFDTLSWMSRPTGEGWHTIPGYFKKFRLGLPIEVNVYDKFNNLLSKTYNNYEYIADNSIPSLSSANKRYSMGHDWAYAPIDYERARLVLSSCSTYVKDISNSNLLTFIATTVYNYDENDNITLTQTTDSKGDVFKHYNLYNYNIPYPEDIQVISTDDLLAYLDDNKLQHKLVSETWKMVGSDSVMLNCNIISPAYSSDLGGDVIPNTFKIVTSYATHLKEPLTSAQVANTGSGKKIDRFNAIYNGISVGSALFKESETTLFDEKGKSLEVYDYRTETYSSVIFDSVTLEKLAEVANAKYEDIAFSSFEGKYHEHSTNTTKGNWIFDPANITKSQKFTGYYSLKMDGSTTVNSQSLHSKKYILSFWAKSDVPLVTLVGVSVLTTELMNTVGDWNLYVATFDAHDNEHLEISNTSGQDIYLDELRLHPAGAAMTSYTYVPLYGLKSKNDPGNYVIYYDYWLQGRPWTTRDMRNKIITQTEIQYADPDKKLTSPILPGGGS